MALKIGVSGLVMTYKKSVLERQMRHYRHLYDIDALSNEDMKKWIDLTNEHEKLIK